MWVAEGGADVVADGVAGGRGIESCAEGGAVEMAVGVGDCGVGRWSHCMQVDKDSSDAVATMMAVRASILPKHARVSKSAKGKAVKLDSSSESVLVDHRDIET